MARYRSLATGTVLSCLTLLIWGCSEAGGVSGAGTRMVVIGIDSADWTLLDELMDAGALPHLSRLKQRGAWGELQTLTDIPLSPVVWTSIATGKIPAKHGVTWFLVDQPDGTRTPVRSTNRRTEALWTIVDRAGLRSCSVGWWATYPAEELQQGIMVSDAMGFHGFGATARDMDERGKVSPARLFSRFDALMPVQQQVETAFVQRFIDIDAEQYAAERYVPSNNRSSNPFNPIHLFQQYAVTAAGYTAIAKQLLEEDEFELMLLYYEQTDSLSHLFMKYDPPRLPWVDERGVQRFSRTVREWYRYQDEILGELLERIDLEQTALLIISDHGFKTGSRRIRSERVVDVQKAHLDHEQEGIFLAVGPHILRGVEIEGASVLDITPTVLHYLGLPVGKDMDGRVLTSALSESFQREHPLRYVSSHETGQRPSSAAVEPGAGTASAAEAGLRSLGYLGDEEEEPAEFSSPEMHNNLGQSLLASGDTAGAQKEFERALKLDPLSADALLALGQIHQLEGRAEAALHYAERALTVDPNSVGALAQLGAAKLNQEDYREAARLYRAALALNDSEPSLFVGLGNVLQRAGNLQGAEKAFLRALELDPDDFAAHYNLGVTYERLGRTEDAVEKYEQALTIDESRAQAAFALNNLGAIHKDAGRTQMALDAYNKAAELFPFHLESRFNAAMIHLRAGQLEPAIERLTQASTIQPNHEQVQLQLGLALLLAGRSEDAYRSLMTVRRLHPENWRATVGLAALEARTGNADRASELLREARGLAGTAAQTFIEGFKALQEF